MRRLTLIISSAAVTAALAAFAHAGSGATLSQAQAAGWDCAPLITIGGYFHCAPPGKPSVADLIAGTDVPTIVLRAYNDDADRTLAGTEVLLRADLYAGQPCPQDNLATWDLLPFGYYACHHFDA